MLSQLLGRIHRDKARISCLGQHLNFKGNSQVKNNKINLFVQQYEQFTILEEESIDSDFAKFNTIITSLKALDEGFSSKNYVRKFLRYLRPKWRAKVMVIEESKDLSSLALDELIDNLKSSDDETSTSRSDDEEYDVAVRNFKKFFRRKGKFVTQPREEKKSSRQIDEKKGKSDKKCFGCGDPNHLIGDCPKPPLNKDQKAFIRGSWSDSENNTGDKTNDETCLMAQSSNEVTLNSSYYIENASSIDNDSLGFDSGKVSTSGTNAINFVGSSAGIAPDGSTIKAHRSTILRSLDPSSGEKSAKHVFIPPMSLRSDFVITRKKLIHNKIEESKKPSLKPLLKSGLGYVKTESRSKTPPPRGNIFSQPRYNTPQPRRKSREPMHQNFYPMNWNNNQSQGFVHMVCLRTCLEPDEWIKDSGCSKHMTGNKSLFSTYKAYDG
ncbi:zf-CCHC domain-containing protein, partial [Tanacetum coccineum]